MRKLAILMIGCLLYPLQVFADIDWSLDQAESIQGGWERGGNPTIPVCLGADPHGIRRPGKLVNGRCNLAYEDREFSSDPVGILKGTPGEYSWESVNRAKPINWMRFHAGTAGNQDVFICRAKHRKNQIFDRGMHPGEYVGRECRYGYGGRAETVSNILTDGNLGDIESLFLSSFDVLYVPRPVLSDAERRIADAAVSEIEAHWLNKHGFLNIYAPDNEVNDNENPTLFSAEYIFLLRQLGLLTGERRRRYGDWARRAISSIRLEPGLFDRIPEDRTFDRDERCIRHFSRDEQIGLIVIDWAFDYELGFARELYERGERDGWQFENRTWRPNGGEAQRICNKKEQWVSPSNLKVLLERQRTWKFRGLARSASGHDPQAPDVAEIIGGLMITANRDPESTSGKILAHMRGQILLESQIDVIGKSFAVYENHMIDQYGANPLRGLFGIYFQNSNHPIHILVDLYKH